MAEKYVLHCEGSLTFCTDGIPSDLFGCVQDERRFLYCWNDGKWGEGTELGGGLADGGTAAGKSGQFRLGVEVRQEDTELLKLQGSIRLSEQSSGNTRTIAVGTGGVPLDSLLQGKEVSFQLDSPFNAGNCVQGTIRAVNAHEFANITGAPVAGKPFIRLRPTALRQLPAYNDALKAISTAVQENLRCNNIGMPPGGEMFRTGISRSPRLLALTRSRLARG